MLEAVKSPVVYFFTMMVVFSAASLSPSPPTLMAAKVNPPALLAGLGSIAAAIAAVFDWYVVRRLFRVETLVRVREHRLFERAERMAKVAPFLTIVVFAALPLPFLIPRVLMPLSGYPLRRYVAAVAIGRFPRVFVIASFGQVVDVPGWALSAAFAAGVIATVITAVARRAGWVRGSKGAPEEPPVSGD